MDKIKEKWASCFIKDTFLADMTSTQRGKSMNNLMKSYIDASYSLLDFLKAFKSALEQRENDLHLTKYNPLEYQASEILTNYALKLTQEQLLQSTSYLCIELLDSRIETMQTYQIYRFNHETKPGRKVVHNATQLNLNNLPESLFHNQRRKDPSNLVLMQNFHLFCNNIQSPNDKIIERVEDYEYLLSKVFHEIKGLVKKNPQTATNNSKKREKKITKLIDMEIVEIDNGLSKKKDNELSCLFYNQSLPNPLPKKLLDYLKILQNKDKILETDRAEFCFMHYTKTAIV
ncbi:unnamed protein product [Rhizophagus irregularis]|nr:unnamed protein product [Rhizophagus irregularis]